MNSMNWLPISTRPDIATITNFLAKYISDPSKGHIEAAKQVFQYLKGARNIGISFHSGSSTHLQGYLKFPVGTLTAFSNANRGPQDQSVPKLLSLSIHLM